MLKGEPYSPGEHLIYWETLVMPDLMDTIDYETFEYQRYDELPCATLGEAIRKAEELRSLNTRNFYRIVPVDSELTAFRVEAVPKIKVYTNFLSRISERWAS